MSGLEPLGLLAIVAMAILVYLMRAGGFWVMSHVPLTPGIRRMLEALPGSIVASIVLPLLDRIGPVALAAGLTAAVVMILRRNELIAVGAGVLVAVLARGAAG